MKKDIQIGLAVIAIFSICGNCGIIMAAENEEEIMLADPTIFPYEGKYYMAGTQVGNPAGFTVYESDNLINWYSTDSLPNLSVGFVLGPESQLITRLPIFQSRTV